MQPPGSTRDLSWPDALREAARRLPIERAGSHLFYEDRHDLTVELQGDADRLVCTRTGLRGLAARGPIGGPTIYRSNPDPSDAARLAAAVAANDVTTDLAGVEPQTHAIGREPEKSTSTHAEEILMNAASETKKLHSAAMVQGRWVGFDQEVVIARPDSGLTRDRRRGGRLRLEAVVSVEAGRAVIAVEEAVGLDFDAATGTALAVGVAKRLAERMGARAAPPGPRSVVFAPGVAGILVHEIVGHALEADVMLGGGSWLSRCGEGDIVASPELTVIDDPRRGRGSWRVDDEGQTAGPTPLIRNGALAGSLCDLDSALRMNRRPTGHGRRASYREPVMPRMGCTFVAAGRFEPEELLDGVVDGVYVRRMEAANTDPHSGNAVFRVTDSDRIRYGRLVSPLEPHLLRVNAREVLTGIDRIANDLRFDPCVGSCVRDGQPLSVSVGGPTIRIGLVSVLA